MAMSTAPDARKPRSHSRTLSTFCLHPDVVDLEDVVVDDALDQVGQPPTGEDGTEERSPRPQPGPLDDASPQHREPEDHDDPGADVEEAVDERVRPETVRRSWDAKVLCQH